MEAGEWTPGAPLVAAELGRVGATSHGPPGNLRREALKAVAFKRE